MHPYIPHHWLPVKCSCAPCVAAGCVSGSEGRGGAGALHCVLQPGLVAPGRAGGGWTSSPWVSSTIFQQSFTHLAAIVHSSKRRKQYHPKLCAMTRPNFYSVCFLCAALHLQVNWWHTVCVPMDGGSHRGSRARLPALTHAPLQ